MKHGIDKASAALDSPCALLCFVALFLLVPQAYARQGASGVRGTVPLDRLYHHTVWTLEDGLPQNSVNDIIQTRDGYLWLATFGGLVRFDGLTFTVFDVANAEGLASNRMMKLYEDRSGALWIGHQRGEITRYQDGVFTPYSDVFPAWAEAFVEDGEGRFWSFTWDRAARFTGEGFTTDPDKVETPPGYAKLPLLRDREGAFWYAVADSLTRYAGGQVTVFTREDGLPQAVGEQFFEDHTGALWLRIQNDSTRVVRYADGRFSAYDLGGTLLAVSRRRNQDETVHLFIKRQSQLLLLEVTPPGADPEAAVASLLYDFVTPAIRKVFTDREGNIWVGTAGQGLHRFREKPLRRYATAEGLPIGGRRITTDGAGGLWVSSECQGLFRFQGGVFTHQPILGRRNLRGCVVSMLLDRKGTLWFGVGGGAYLAMKTGTLPTTCPKTTTPTGGLRRWSKTTTARSGSARIGGRWRISTARPSPSMISTTACSPAKSSSSPRAETAPSGWALPTD